MSIFGRLWLINRTEMMLQHRDASLAMGVDATFMGDRMPQVCVCWCVCVLVCWCVLAHIRDHKHAQVLPWPNHFAKFVRQITQPGLQEAPMEEGGGVGDGAKGSPGLTTEYPRSGDSISRVSASLLSFSFSLFECVVSFVS